MDSEKKLELISQVGEEIITQQELKELIETKSKPVAYDGFEPSGKIHIAQGILRAINVNKMTSAGVKFRLLVADWHAWANNKLGGDLEKIGIAGDYMVEVWKSTGMDFSNVEFVRASSLVENPDYWKIVMKIATASTLKRTIRCSQIMGRSESEILQSSQIFYPCMQAADIFKLDVDIAQLGMDQRKVNVFAREIADKLSLKKPVAVHHHMLMGLNAVSSGSQGIDRAIEMKMSKSNPNSAIFMTDSEKDVSKKISKAYCPEKIAEDNPILEYCRYIVFEKYPSFEIHRPAKFGGDVSFASYAELESAFVAGKVHPMDLKTATADYINQMLEPVRTHFSKNSKAKKLLEKVESF